MFSAQMRGGFNESQTQSAVTAKAHIAGDEMRD